MSLVATMISFLARSACVSPSKTSTVNAPPWPVSRAVPLIQSIFVFLEQELDALAQAG